MADSRSVPSVSALRARYEQRVERLTTLRQVRSELVSLAGLIGKPVLNQAGEEIGKVADVVARWVINELPRELGDRPLDGTKLTGKGLGTLVVAVESGEITGTAAKDIFAELVQQGGDPRQIIDERGLAQVSDEDAIAAIVNEVLAANADKVDLYRAGKTGLLGFFVGQVLRSSQGKANPVVVQRLLGARLG